LVDYNADVPQEGAWVEAMRHVAVMRHMVAEVDRNPFAITAGLFRRATDKLDAAVKAFALLDEARLTDRAAWTAGEAGCAPFLESFGPAVLQGVIKPLVAELAVQTASVTAGQFADRVREVHDMVNTFKLALRAELGRARAASEPVSFEAFGKIVAFEFWCIVLFN